MTAYTADGKRPGGLSAEVLPDLETDRETALPETERYEFFMREALRLAAEAADEGEVPVGAVVVLGDEIIGRGRNSTVRDKNPLSHAEMNAIREALPKVGGWRLVDCELYVTLEPCAMCAGAVVHARLRKLIVGAPDPKTGACGSVLDVTGEKRLNHQPQVIRGVLREECSRILKDFFRELRRK